MDSTAKTRLEALLRRIQLLLSASNQPNQSPDLKEAFNEICRLVLDDELYQALWDEPILSQLGWLFQVKPPAPALFGSKVTDLCLRAHQAQQVNDFFFQILNRDAPVEKVYEALSSLALGEPSVLSCLKRSARLEDIRGANGVPSEKINAFLDFLREDLGSDLASLEPVIGCLEALRARERTGMVNALLVGANGVSALVVPLYIKLQPGSGAVHSAIHAHEEFRVAIERARLAVCDRGFLSHSDDIVYSLTPSNSQSPNTKEALSALRLP